MCCIHFVFSVCECLCLLLFSCVRMGVCMYMRLCVGPSVGREIVRDTGVHAYVIISSRLLYV